MPCMMNIEPMSLRLFIAYWLQKYKIFLINISLCLKIYRYYCIFALWNPLNAKDYGSKNESRVGHQLAKECTEVPTGMAAGSETTLGWKTSSESGHDRMKKFQLDRINKIFVWLTDIWASCEHSFWKVSDFIYSLHISLVAKTIVAVRRSNPTKQVTSSIFFLFCIINPESFF